MNMTIGSLYRIKKAPVSQVVKFNPKLYLKSCDRCQGDVEFSYDLVTMANTLTCLMCGWWKAGKSVIS